MRLCGTFEGYGDGKGTTCQGSIVGESLGGKSDAEIMNKYLRSHCQLHKNIDQDMNLVLSASQREEDIACKLS